MKAIVYKDVRGKTNKLSSLASSSGRESHFHGRGPIATADQGHVKPILSSKTKYEKKKKDEGCFDKQTLLIWRNFIKRARRHKAKVRLDKHPPCIPIGSKGAS